MRPAAPAVLRAVRHVDVHGAVLDPGRAQVVVGSDYPFLDVPPQWPLTELTLPEPVEQAVRETNAPAFLGL